VGAKGLLSSEHGHEFLSRNKYGTTAVNKPLRYATSTSLKMTLEGENICSMIHLCVAAVVRPMNKTEEPTTIKPEPIYVKLPQQLPECKQVNMICPLFSKTNAGTE
jgi:hypothetical protein